MVCQRPLPFANDERAATDQFHRIEKIWHQAYGPNSVWLMGVANDEDLKKAEARRAKIETYYKDAARVARIELSSPFD